MTARPLRVQVMSDLHLEFYRDRGAAFLAALDPSGADVLVVAGDLTSASLLADALTRLCSKYRDVVYVSGNHEAYGTTPRSVEELRDRLVRDLNNLYWLDEDFVVIQGQRFVGTTLWFPDSPESRSHRDRVNDFRMIRDFTPWVFEKNARAVRFLDENVHAGDVVVTHYLPSQRSVDFAYAGDPSNAFFVCDVEPLVAQRSAALWVHGHTHTACDYALGRTMVLCNPRGYPREASASGFDEKLVVEVGRSP